MYFATYVHNSRSLTPDILFILENSTKESQVCLFSWKKVSSW